MILTSRRQPHIGVQVVRSHYILLLLFTTTTPAATAPRAEQVARLSALLGERMTGADVSVAIARAIYRCPPPDTIRQATGDFNQALTPASATSLAQLLTGTPISARRILWVGCGHGLEAIVTALLSTEPISIFAVDHTQSCIDNACALLRQVYMAVMSCSAAAAANLDLTGPVPLGMSTIQVVMADAWHFAFPSDYDLIYSAAEQECDDGRQPISLLLQALAGGIAMLAMYSTMWSKARHRASPVGPELRVALERGHRTIVTRDLRCYPMFLQPSTTGSRSSLSPAGWTTTAFGCSLLHFIGQRVAVFFPDDNLWFPSYVILTSDLLVVLQFDDSHWPDLEILSTDSPPLLTLSSSHGSTPSSVPIGLGSVAPAPMRRSPRLSASDADMVSLQSTSGPPCPSSSAAPPLVLSAKSLDGLYLSSSESGYQGVYRDEHNGSYSSWYARIWRNGGWHRLGIFESAHSAALAYKQARDTPHATTSSAPAERASIAPSHCVYPYPRSSRADLWIARTYSQGSYHVLGSVLSRPDVLLPMPMSAPWRLLLRRLAARPTRSL